jgi:hypothetical protein
MQKMVQCQSSIGLRMLRMRSLLSLLLLVSIPVMAASVGQITDAATGKPIAGATVYVFWSYHPVSIPTPVEAPHADRLCGGSTVAITDVNGNYRLDPAFNIKTRIHETHQFVVADGYYNDWEGPEQDDKHDFAQLLLSLQWDPSRRQEDTWSKRLNPLGDAPIDVRLLTLTHAASHNSLCNEHNEDVGLKKFRRAALRAMTNAICQASKSGTSPRADVFRGAFGAFTPDSQLPRRRRSPVSLSLVDATCAKMTEEMHADAHKESR